MPYAITASHTLHVSADGAYSVRMHCGQTELIYTHSLAYALAFCLHLTRYC